MRTHLSFLFRFLFGSLLAAAASSTLNAGEPWLEKSNLFAGGDYGYSVYHIPAVLVTAKGTVIVWCEARNPGSDWGHNVFLMRRSADDGKTFGPVSHLPEVEGPIRKNPVSLRLKGTKTSDVTYDNAVMIADRDGTVHLVFCLEYERCFYCRSNDDGVSWTKPVEITSTFAPYRAQYDWKVFATGPDHGIQLSSGRLLIPVWLSLGTGGGAHRPSVTSTIYSDDGGSTWKAGEIAVPNTPTWINPNETTAAELADGTVMLNVRTESKANRRLITTSPSGIGDWSPPQFDSTLLEPICMGSLVRLSLAKDSGKNRLLFVNPANLERSAGPAQPGMPRDRKNMTVRISYDEGKTWKYSRVLEPSWSAYTDIAVSPTGTILCFYGSGARTFTGAYLTLARFNLEWLTDGRDSLK